MSGAVLLAACENDGCRGTLRYRWGQPEAPCDTCGGRCGVAVASWTGVEPAAPRRESGGQQQAAAEVLDQRHWSAAVGARPHHEPCTFPDDMCACGAVQDRYAIAAALAEAARPGQELRARVANLADIYENASEWAPQTATYTVAKALRAALEDPR